MPVRAVRLENVRISATDGGTVSEAEGLSLRGVEVDVEKGPVLPLRNARDVELRGGVLTTSPPAGVALRVEGRATANVRLQGVTLRDIDTPVSLAPSVPAGAVVVME